MRGASIVLGLGLTLGVAGAARAGEPVAAASAGVALPDSVRPQVEAALELRARGMPGVATHQLIFAYDRLATQPRRHLAALHAIVSDAVNSAATAYRVGEDPAPVCAAFAVLDRHAARVRALELATPAFDATIADVRSDLGARLAARGHACTGRSAAPGTPGQEDMLLGPGRLAQDLADRPARATYAPQPRLDPGKRRARVVGRVGLALMGTGLMMLGAGLGVGAAERIDRRDLLQGGMFAGGTLMFVGGLPLLVIGEQRARATLAVRAGGLAIGF